MENSDFKIKVKETLNQLFVENESHINRMIDEMIINCPTIIKRADNNYRLPKTAVVAILERLAKEIGGHDYHKGFDDRYVRENRKNLKQFKAVVF